MVEARRYTLDTSAIMAYFADEAGADRVERILTLSDRGTIDAYASFMTYMEVLYAVWRRLGEKTGKATYLRLKALAIRRVDASEELLLAAARIKATHELSVADAWIAATALVTGGTLVHKDPEFRSLAGELPLLELPLKPSPARPRSM
ncbi:MAG: type II toxin-antitoxin system VapC family toxin [Candidatus Rokubacteria bacterium]|nr:type II toxin-antitoxin system VapC family toxin [Candidatus Rokubacteria bacterium]